MAHSNLPVQGAGYGPARQRGTDPEERVVANVEAHITGTVWKIEVKVGDQIEEGDTVVILESMKMEMPVEAAQAGRVSRVHVSEGQAVDEGDPLVSLE
jgi:acetyl-CoA carboxylase biotin carboxyl carrier protein